MPAVSSDARACPYAISAFTGAVDEVLEAFPRLEFKQSVVDTMIDQCKRKPTAVFLTQFAETGRRHIPGFTPPILEDLVLAAPYES